MLYTIYMLRRRRKNISCEEIYQYGIFILIVSTVNIIAR